MLSYQKALDERGKKSLLRQLPIVEGGIDFFSNDYLGLSKSEEFKQLIDDNHAKQNPLNGSTGSRLLSGNSKLIEETEHKIAIFHLAEAALIYNSGYSANLGLISSLATRNTTLVMDELCHASLIDGARLGPATRLRFRHNDPTDLMDKLEKTKGQSITIIESVYSMDGDIAPINEIADICLKYNSLLIVDEAHGIGVFGDNGAGLVGELQLETKVFARIITYGKAPGIHGASVIGPKWLKNYQINFARPFIFSTAPSPHQIITISSFYDFIPMCKESQKNLRETIDYFILKRNTVTGRWLDSPSQIQSLIVSGNEEVMQRSNDLKNAGINALPIRKPSVAEGQERIRFCLHSYNSKEEINHLFDTLDSFN